MVLAGVGGGLVTVCVGVLGGGVCVFCLAFFVFSHLFFWGGSCENTNTELGFRGGGESKIYVGGVWGGVLGAGLGGGPGGGGGVGFFGRFGVAFCGGGGVFKEKRKKEKV